MAIYERSAARDYRVIDRWSGGVGWLAHPGERGRRASHAIQATAGVWLVDPLDAPGIADLIASQGDVAGVVVCADYHARDAATFADRYDVAVTVPDHLERVTDRIDAPVEPVSGHVAGFDLRAVRPLGLWREVIAYRPADGTLYVPDLLSAHEAFTVGDERVGLPTFSRLRPPRSTFADLDPERILLGHGEGVFEDPAAALATAVERARSRFPAALVSNLPAELRMMLAALR